MHVIYTERHKLHATGDLFVEGVPLGSFEVPARAEVLLQAVQSAGLGTAMEPVDHGLAPILAVHDGDFVEFLRTARHEGAGEQGRALPLVPWTFANRRAVRRPRAMRGLLGYYAFGWGSPILEGTWEAAYWSAQCALTAADLLREGETLVYALCRPPGHHAGTDLFGGYCYLNNAAIAAHALRATGRIAILDVDYHHGNGTQLIFYSDPDVLYCSLHVHPDEDYPYYWGGADERGAGRGEGANQNWPLPRSTGDEEYLATLDRALAVIGEFQPRSLVVSAGFDGLDGDPEGSFRLTVACFGEIGRRVGGLGLPTAIVQEGGYRLEELGASAAAFLRGCAESAPQATPGEG
jgi:acetoin utilization deacetylase AcuC-like enzyme